MIAHSSCFPNSPFRASFPFVQRLVFLILLPIAFSCAITEDELDREIEKRGGVVINHPRQVRLGGSPGFVVGAMESELITRPSIQINLSRPPRCASACWETVYREYLDGEPVLDPSRVSNDPDEIRVRTERAPDGYVVDLPPVSFGRGDDGACDTNKSNTEYHDSPNFPDSAFPGSTRLMIIEFETCYRCLIPKSAYLGCMKWAYVKVKADDGKTHVRLISTGQPHLPPSAQFRAAVEAFNRPQ